MAISRFGRPWTGLWILFLMFSTVPAAGQAPPDRMVVFGTSLSDPGNAFALTKEALTPPYETLNFLLVPDAPYAKGGHHFSNGPTWVEEFARSMGLASGARPALAGAGLKAANYAVGAARAREDGINFNLSVQREVFMADVGGSAPPGALYVVEMGGNDVRDALAAAASGGDGVLVIQEALNAIGTHLGDLYAAGARSFLVLNVPNLRWLPAVRRLDLITPGAADAAEFLTLSFNTALEDLLTGMEGLPGIRIVRVDIFHRLNDMVEHPADFGLVNVDTACVSPHRPPYSCRRPDGYLFWDGIHPTRSVHAILAHAAAAAWNP